MSQNETENSFVDTRRLFRADVCAWRLCPVAAPLSCCCLSSMAAAEEEAGYGAPEEAPVPRASVSTPRLSEVGELAEKIMDDAEVNTLSPDVPHLSLWAPEQRHLVVMLFKALLGSCTLLSAVFITLLLLFFGSGWNPAWYYWRIKIGVLDLDGALVGTALRGVANSGKVPFTTVDLSGSTFDSLWMPAT